MLHLVSPLSQGLFHKVIALSGTGSTPFMHNDRKPQHYARAAAKKLVAKNGEDYTDEELLAKLRLVPAKKIAILSSMFKDWDSSLPVCFKPCLDPQDGADAFLPIPFVQAVQEGNHFHRSDSPQPFVGQFKVLGLQASLFEKCSDFEFDFKNH